MILLLEALALATTAVLGAWLLWRAVRMISARLRAFRASATHGRWFVRAALGVLALVLIQIGSYELFAERQTSFTLDRFLPQHTHFNEDTTFRFACISEDLVQRLTDQDQKALKNHLLRWFPEVYLGEQSIPATNKNEHTNLLTGQRMLRDLKSGCVITMSVRRKGLMWFQGDYADWEGNLAAGTHQATFIWVLGRWWRTSMKRGPGA